MMAATTTLEKRSPKTRPTLAVSPGGPWHTTVPAAVRKAYRSPAEGRGWEAWRKHLARRKLRPVDRLIAGTTSPLLWSLAGEPAAKETLRLIKLLRGVELRPRAKSAPVAKRAAEWLTTAETAEITLELALECLAWARALAPLAAQLDERLWWRLANTLVQIAGRPVSGEKASNGELHDEAPADVAAAVTANNSAIVEQLLNGELALTLAYSLPELNECRALATTGRRTVVGRGFERLTSQGLPVAKELPWLRPLVATWTRSVAIGTQLPESWRGSRSLARYTAAVRQALAWSRADGSAMFTAAEIPKWNKELKAAAILLAGPTLAQVAKVEAGKRPSAKAFKELPAVSGENENARVALLRTDWSATAPRLGVRYHGSCVELELCAGTRCLWQGPWTLDVQLNGQTLKPVDSWEQVCWEADADVDYLELGLTLEGEVMIERHILLSRQSRALVLADTVLGIQAGSLEYRSCLPLGDRSQFVPERETREGTLVSGGKPVARALPLALPEWRAERGVGALTATNAGLEISQTSPAERMFVPLLIDVEPARIRQPLTWRRLTVGQDREIVPADEAVGYRAQVGSTQWVVYRSLTEPAVRTVLGKNLMHEFLVGHFPPNGRIQTVLEIDST